MHCRVAAQKVFGTDDKGSDGEFVHFHGAESAYALLVAVFPVLFRRECLLNTLHCFDYLNDILLNLEDVNHESDRFDDHGEHLRHPIHRDKIHGWLASRTPSKAGSETSCAVKNAVNASLICTTVLPDATEWFNS